MNLNHILGHLNERQKQAVLHGDGPLLILAGAGSGKTTTMASRIAHLVAVRGVAPHRILGLSFTRKAATELKERVVKQIKKVTGKTPENVSISTFHSLCVQILRAQHSRLGLPKNFSIIDTTDRKDVIRSLMRDIKLDDRRFDPDNLGFQISQAKNKFLSPAEAEPYFLSVSGMPEDYGIAATSLYPRYEEKLATLGALDFDDLIFKTARLLESFPEVRNEYSTRFQYILVDEYQDTNPAQSHILHSLTSLHKNICVVGDDDQSIYAWRGADSRHILEFASHFPGARVITLDQNYRSTTRILEAANQVIAKNRHRHPKSLWSDRGEGEPLSMTVLEEDRAEAEYVAEEILSRKAAGQHYSSMAVLFRSNPQARVFEEALRLRQIPYKIVGSMSFLDRKEVKDVLSYWRLVLNPKDEPCLRRVINSPARGVGKSAMDTLHAHAVSTGGCLWDSIQSQHETLSRGKTGVIEFMVLIHELREKLSRCEPTPAALAAWGLASLDSIGLKQALFEEFEDPAQAEKRWEIAEELSNALGQIKVPSGGFDSAETILREYVAKMVLESQDDREDSSIPKDEVQLLTLHSAKGLEFPTVFLVGIEDGLLPHQKTIDQAADLSEERRLFYVGITRAKDRLYLTRTRTRIRYGKAVPRNPSRFIEELPMGAILHEDRSAEPVAASKAAAEKHEEQVKGFLAGLKGALGKSPSI